MNNFISYHLTSGSTLLSHRERLIAGTASTTNQANRRGVRSSMYNLELNFILIFFFSSYNDKD